MGLSVACLSPRTPPASGGLIGAGGGRGASWMALALGQPGRGGLGLRGRFSEPRMWGRRQQCGGERELTGRVQRPCP